jgi:hypothetical protein
MTYWKRLAIAVDQFLNTLMGGYPDETLSARAHRRGTLEGSTKWRGFERVFDLMFFWEQNPGHCQRSFISEMGRMHLQEPYR